MSFLSLMGDHIDLKVGDKTYKLAPLGFAEMAEYLLWYQYKEVEEVEKTTKCFSPAMREKLIKDTYDKYKAKCYKYTDENGEEKTGPLSWETQEVQDSGLTVEGLGYQIYLSLKINHPEINREGVSKIVTLKTFNDLFDKFMQLQGVSPVDISDGEPEPGK